MSAQALHFSALGRALVQQGKLLQADANAIQSEATKAGISFVQQLVQSKKLSAKEVAVTAPDAGSDVAGLRTRAERRGGDWVLNGSKMFITNGALADLIFVAARTDGADL